MQWSANAEILHYAGILDIVEKFQGSTLDSLEVEENENVNVLIAKAQNPLPNGINLPNGKIDLLVATVPTDDEMQWSKRKNGPEALLAKLIDSRFSIVNDRDRKPVLK